MSEQQHTAGPWLIDVANYHAGHIATVDHNGQVIEIWSETWPMPEQGPANARLIAAAPELLEALQPFANFACDEPCACNNCKARAAIAKATGR